MNNPYAFHDGFNLHVEGRISTEDAERQRATAKEILQRLSTQPGVILADEVGMGKTFVALAVALSVAHSNRGHHPVVVMTPSSLRRKWPTDFKVFVERCVPEALRKQFRCREAEHAVDFLKILDDPPSSRASVIFLTHGAMSRGLTDQWVMLALIWQSLYRKWGSDEIRGRLGRFLGPLLQLKWAENKREGIWDELLRKHPKDWGTITRSVLEDQDDPVPAAIIDVLPQLDTLEIYDLLNDMPVKQSKNFDDRIKNARHAIKNACRAAWKECLKLLKVRLPLLILDEAHHLKNSDTQLASLFRSEDAVGDADEISKGPLAGVFDRMLFLTATPFQLGHDELCSVLDRFDGVRWLGTAAPTMEREQFRTVRSQLRDSLDGAQEAAVALDHAWGRLVVDDLVAAGQPFPDVDAWWPHALAGAGLTPAASDVVQAFERTRSAMQLAESRLRPWVIRHLKPRHLPGEYRHLPRRERRIGRAIAPDCPDGECSGIALAGEALLPFLLAARASLQTPEARPVFAEGLASSYEAFLKTRIRNLSPQTAENERDLDDDDAGGSCSSDALDWYLNQLESLLPRDVSTDGGHPKVSATVARVVDLWRQGEKVVVFCHYVETGRVLRQRISAAIRSAILEQAVARLNCSTTEAELILEAKGRRFFDSDSPARQTSDEVARSIIAEYPELSGHAEQLVEIVRRYLRTPSFLVRFLPIENDVLDAGVVRQAFDRADQSGLTFRQLLRTFFSFLAVKCEESERQRVLEALLSVQTGSHLATDVANPYDDDELQGSAAERLLPNVRLVNGRTRDVTRQKLMLAFNTPFYPEVLIASSVMSEGVDLHRNCRYILHHDLCWNPSMVEQRTGRVDRIGAKAETAGRPIQIYIPFIAETQDEKMFRVVMDRERWFGVVMGEKYQVDVRSTESLAARIPLADDAAESLGFNLSVWCDASSI